MISSYDETKAVKEFDETKEGVKGLVDSGIIKIPKFFIHPLENLPNIQNASGTSRERCFNFPVINLEGFEGIRREEILDEIVRAAETWGFFQLINHGIPLHIMQEILDSIKKFHEQPNDAKIKWYTSDPKQPVKFYTSAVTHKGYGNWRDSLGFDFSEGELEPQTFPLVCREVVSKYRNHMIKLKKKLAELLSEALGLHCDYLASIGCMETEHLLCHYYPSCPEPDLTLGATKHSDPDFLTIVLQDNIGGLQILHQNNWVDVPPLLGAFVINIGDFLQLITNDRFRSVEHRVLVGKSARVSVACFCNPSSVNKFKPYAPIKELLTEECPPKYRGVSTSEYMAYFRAKGLDEWSHLSHFKL